MRAIDEGGEGSVNVHRVAKEAGVTVPSLYHFFGNREGLVEEAQVHRFEEGLRLVGISLDEVLAGATTKKQYRDTIRKWLVSVTGANNSNFRRTRTTVIASAVNNPSLAARIAEIQDTHVRRMGTFLSYGTKKGWVDADIDIEAVIFWTITQLNGRMIIELDPKNRYSDSWNALFIKSIMQALRFA